MYCKMKKQRKAKKKRMNTVKDIENKKIHTTFIFIFFAIEFQQHTLDGYE